MKRAAIGLKTKTGRAIAVVLAGSADNPEFVCREELRLYDENVSDSIQPYHQVMEMPWSDWDAALEPKIAAIDNIANSALGTFIEAMRSRKLRIACVVVIGPDDRKLERIGNPHIRAHAGEGVLYRAVMERAAKKHRIPTRTFADPEDALGRPSREVKKVLTRLGEAAGPPWRSEEKSAAMAAWIALRSRTSAQ
jgi:hypothetical protein